MKKILIIAAIYDEVIRISKEFKKKDVTIKNNSILESGEIAGRKTDILVTGPTIFNTLFTLGDYFANSEKPDLIIQTGCAGGFKEAGIKKGDTGIASSETYIHLGVENPATKFMPAPLPFPVSKKPEITNSFQADPELSRRAKVIIDRALNIHSVITPFITVSEITASKKSAKDLFRVHECGFENMEGAASFYAASIQNIPFLEIRSASNITGVRDKGEWDLSLAFKNASDAVRAVLEEI